MAVAQLILAIPAAVISSEDGMRSKQRFEMLTDVVVEKNLHALIFSFCVSKKRMIARKACLSA